MITINESTRSQTSTANAILSKASKNRVKNATEVLERYIEQFADVVQTNASGTPIPGCYGSSKSRCCQRNINPSLLQESADERQQNQQKRKEACQTIWYNG